MFRDNSYNSRIIVSFIMHNYIMK